MRQSTWLREWWTIWTNIPATPDPLAGRTWLRNLGIVGIVACFFAVWVEIDVYRNTPPQTAFAAVLFVARFLRIGIVGALCVWSIGFAGVRAPNNVERRKGRVLLILVGLLGLMLVSVFGLATIGGQSNRQVSGFLVTVIGLILVWLMVRRGHVTPAALAILAGFATVNVSLDVSASIWDNGLCFALGGLLAGLLVRWWAAFVYVAVFPLYVLLLPTQTLMLEGPAELAIAAVILLISAGVVALYAHELEQALAIADEQTTALTASQAELAHQNSLLAQQAAALRETQAVLRDTIEHQEAQIAAAVDALRARSVEIDSLQTPLIRVADDVLVAPLIGVWDEARAERFRVQLLTAVASYRAATVVLDVTGITLATTSIVPAMIQQLYGATRLLGCRCVLAGIQPEMSQLLVTSGQTLDGAVVVKDLAAALRLALRRPA